MTLGEGFHAQAGSDFRAYIDDCTPLREGGTPGQGIAEQQNTSMTWEVFPVPSESSFTLRITGHLHNNVVVMISDLSGRVIKKVNTGTPDRTAGMMMVEVDHSNISAGTYLCTLQVGDSVESKLVILK